MQIDLQNAVIILVLCFATLQNKLATAVLDSLDLLGPASNFCNNFSSSPDWFPGSSTSSQLTKLIIT